MSEKFSGLVFALFTTSVCIAASEVGLAAGTTVLLIGHAASLHAFGAWGLRSFGPLDPSMTLRIIIPAITSLTLGCQIILSGFFLSILGLRRR